jgi:alpha-ketoglutarate-dependent taurine dioxygenase
MARHRLVQTHEASGRTNLYIAHHAHHIDGLSQDAGQEVIRNLLSHATQEKYTIEVEWESNGDIIIWVSLIIVLWEELLTTIGQYVCHARCSSRSL